MQRRELFSAIVGLTLCIETPLKAESAPPPAAGVSVNNAWVRANAPGLDIAAAYFDLRNTGSRPVVLTGVSTPIAARASLHMSVMTKGISSMRELDSVTVAPHETVRFQPGGMHVMLTGVSRSLQPGQTATLRFTLKDGASLQINAPIRPLSGP